MRRPLLLLRDIGFRTAALLLLTEGVAEISSVLSPGDGLGTGLTVMFVLVCAASAWGLWDGFHRHPGRLCVTWVVTGVLVSLGSTLYSHLRFDEGSWSGLADRLLDGLGFWSALVFVPAICCGIVQSVIGSGTPSRRRLQDVGSRNR